METNSKKILEAMPSFDDFMDLAEEIKKLSVYKMNLENKIKTQESDNFKTVMTDPKYFTNGKPVPVSFYDGAYKHTGLENNLVNLRGELAEVVALLELHRSKFEIFKGMHDLFKTLVYQEKNM